MQQQVAGRYTLLREVGRGGMGAVWLARDEVLGREVALKRLAPRDGMGHAEERVRREARVSAMLNHAGVVTVFDLADDGDDIWLVMEYVDSVTLSELIRRDGPLTPDRTAELVAQAADALAVAHEAGIVHRDVKPGNMLVNDDGHLKLGDFGIARTGGDPSLTATGLVTGSPGYLAPEVAAGSGATIASDVWSLGATIFHALTGKPPYETGDNLMGTLYRLVHEEPPRTDRAGWLDPVLRGTMERDPQRRWSARQVHAFLSAGVGARPPATPTPVAAAAAPPEPPADVPAERTQVIAPGARRSRRPLFALLAVLLAAALGVGAWALLRGDEEPEARDGSTSAAPPATSSSHSPSPTPDEAGMEEFVGTYLDTVTDDPAQAFETMLTPAFQEESGGLPGYRGWWDTVREAELQRVEADPANLTVTYRVHYKMRSGSHEFDEITLGLDFADGTYRIASEQ